MTEEEVERSARRLRWGMVGGGKGSTIGDSHRRAGRYDGRFDLVAGVFATDPGRSRDFAAGLGIARERQYGTWEEMAEREAEREDGIEAVTICTPNDSHHAVASAFLDQGIDVLCDKPLTTSVDDALDLVRRQRDTGLVFAVTYNYTGYVMVRHARDLLASGELGAVRLVQVEFASGWAATLLEAEGHRQASWRTDPASAGASSVVADLGTHAQHLAEFVTGLRVQRVAADLSTLVPGRTADDNAHVMLRFPGEVPGLLWVTMAAAGQLHGLRLRVFAERGGLEWSQEWPNELTVRPLEGPHRTIARGSPEMLPSAARASRMWAGHPEGFAAAFGTVYDDAWSAITARRAGSDPRAAAPDLPTVDDGARGVQFVDAVVRSHRIDGAWVDVPAHIG
ncbi:MAG TPA: Gfo/Idh/MocA family oxidoreductase [Euzebyales bacterium]